ncbi:MAG: helix-turn-helix transcriptional regulator [Chloroflexota bacterium]
MTLTDCAAPSTGRWCSCCAGRFPRLENISAQRMGIDPPALSRLETGKMLNPTLATLHKWAEALGRKLEIALASA